MPTSSASSNHTLPTPLAPAMPKSAGIGAMPHSQNPTSKPTDKKLPPKTSQASAVAISSIPSESSNPTFSESPNNTPHTQSPITPPCKNAQPKCPLNRKGEKTKKISKTHKSLTDFYNKFLPFLQVNDKFYWQTGRTDCPKSRRLLSLSTQSESKYT